MISLKGTYSFVIELDSQQTVSFEIGEAPNNPSFQIDWGDGTVENYNENSPTFSSFPRFGIKAEHNYSEAGTYQVRIQGGPLGKILRCGAPTSDNDILREVTSWGPIGWKSFTNTFGINTEKHTAVSINSYPNEVPVFGNCEYMTNAFGRTSDLVSGSTPSNINIKIPENIGEWDVSSVTDFQNTFGYNQADIPPVTEWDTSSAKNVRDMFRYTSFNQDVSAKQVTKNGTTYIAWDVSNVTRMSDMFEGAENFNQDVGNWNTSNVDFMNGTFDGTAIDETRSFRTKEVTVGSQTYVAWDMSSVQDIAAMFKDTNMNSDIGNWDTSVLQEMGVAFLSTPFNQDISTKTVTVAGNTYTAWDTSDVVDLGLTFQDTPFNQDIGNWDTSSVTNMFQTFRENSAFNQDLSTKTVTVNGDTYVAWDVYNVTDMTRTFANASSFDQNLGNWDVSSLTDAPGMFDGSGMSDENAAKTISGWVNPDYNVAQNDVSDLQSGVTLGLGSNDYTNFSNFGTGNTSDGTFISGQEAIDQLRNQKNWTINIQNG